MTKSDRIEIDSLEVPRSFCILRLRNGDFLLRRKFQSRLVLYRDTGFCFPPLSVPHVRSEDQKPDRARRITRRRPFDLPLPNPPLGLNSPPRRHARGAVGPLRRQDRRGKQRTLLAFAFTFTHRDDGESLFSPVHCVGRLRASPSVTPPVKTSITSEPTGRPLGSAFQ